MSGVIDLQWSGIITLLILQALIIGGWVVVTQGVKISRLQRGLADANWKQTTTASNLVEAITEMETTTNDLDDQVRSLNRRFDRLYEDVTERLDRGDAGSDELRALQQLLESLPENVADQLYRSDTRHNVRRTGRRRSSKQGGDERGDEPLPYMQPA